VCKIELISLAESVRPLVEHFNAGIGHTRLLAFVSPT
jgi:hypothetical protein